MKRLLSFVLLVLLVPALGTYAFADGENSQPDAAQTADNLRFQLLDLQSREAELQARVRILEEDIKPENIERSLAGYGSTRPEELRELRRRQLNLELESVRSQLRLLASAKERLEASIRNADAQAYQQSAEGFPLAQVFRMQSGSTPSWLVLLGGAAVILGSAFAFTVVRRRRSTR